MNKKLLKDYQIEIKIGGVPHKIKLGDLFSAEYTGGKPYFTTRLIFGNSKEIKNREILKSMEKLVVNQIQTTLNDIKTIGDNLRILILINGVPEIADKTGLKSTDIYSWLNGKRKWSFNKILDVAQKISSE